VRKTPQTKAKQVESGTLSLEKKNKERVESDLRPKDPLTVFGSEEKKVDEKEASRCLRKGDEKAGEEPTSKGIYQSAR